MAMWLVYSQHKSVHAIPSSYLQRLQKLQNALYNMRKEMYWTIDMLRGYGFVERNVKESLLKEALTAMAASSHLIEMEMIVSWINRRRITVRDHGEVSIEIN